MAAVGIEGVHPVGLDLEILEQPDNLSRVKGGTRDEGWEARQTKDGNRRAQRGLRIGIADAPLDRLQLFLSCHMEGPAVRVAVVGVDDAFMLREIRRGGRRSMTLD